MSHVCLGREDGSEILGGQKREANIQPKVHVTMPGVTMPLSSTGKKAPRLGSMLDIGSGIWAVHSNKMLERCRTSQQDLKC